MEKEGKVFKIEYYNIDFSEIYYTKDESSSLEILWSLTDSQYIDEWGYRFN